MIRPQRMAGDGRRPDDIVDAYLAARSKVGLEQVLLDGIERRVTSGIAGAVTVTTAPASRWPHSDGGLTEYFSGQLTVEGVAYRFRCETYSVPDAYVHRFLTNVGEFEPVDWTAAARL